MFTTPDGVELYTEEDMNVAREAQRTQFVAGTEYGVRATSNDLRDKAVEWFRGEVREGNMVQEDALGIYNGLAEALGWVTLDSLTMLYSVTVSYNGMNIAEFEDVEADDASSAEDEVRSNMNIDDVEVNFTLSYGDHSHDGSVNMTYEWEDDFEFSASEQN